MNYENKHFKIIEKEYESKFEDYRDIDEEEKEKYINEKLSKLPIHQLIKQLKLDELLGDFDAVSLYPTAMWDKNSIHLRLKQDMLIQKIRMMNSLKNLIVVILHKEVLF